MFEKFDNDTIKRAISFAEAVEIESPESELPSIQNWRRLLEDELKQRLESDNFGLALSTGSTEVLNIGQEERRFRVK